MSDLPLRTAEYTAALIVSLRSAEHDSDAYSKQLDTTILSVATVLANIVLELDRCGAGDKFFDGLPEHFWPLCERYVELMRDVRSRFMDGGETVN